MYQQKIIILGLGLTLVAAAPFALFAQPPMEPGEPPSQPIASGPVANGGTSSVPLVGNDLTRQPIEIERSPDEGVRERGPGTGLSFEVVPEGLEVWAQEAGLWILRAAPDSGSPDVIQLSAGERKIFPLDSDLAVLKLVAYVNGECRTTDQCATPPPIPPALATRFEQQLCSYCPRDVCANPHNVCYAECCG
jgi:hypothetical protein